jgi:hypothetical protein
MAGLEGLMGMGQSPVAPSVLDNFMQGRDPNSQTARDGATAYNTFLPWLATNYESLPSVKLGQKPEFGRAVSAFTQAYPELANTMNNADIYNMLSQAYFSVFQGKAPNSAQ